MPNPEAARLAEALRTAMKSQNLSGAALAREIERLTGKRPADIQISRWLHGERRPLLYVSPHLEVIAQALGLDPVELACNALRVPSEDPEEVAT